MNTKPRQRSSHHPGKPNARRGVAVGLHPVFYDWLVPNVLHQGKTTHVCHGSDGALGFCRELSVYLAAGAPYGTVKPSRAYKVAICTVRDDTTDALARLVESTCILPKYPVAIHSLRFDYWGEMEAPNELARVIRANGSEVILAECGRGALIEVRKHLGDLAALPILAPIDPFPGDDSAIILRLRDDKTFEIAGSDNA